MTAASRKIFWPGLLLAGLLASPVGFGAIAPAHAQPASRAPAKPLPERSGTEAATIVALVNGQVITLGDVDNRRRLFALSTGMSLAPEVLARLNAQVTVQLIDERLKLREMLRRQIVVPEADIAAAIQDVEGRIGLPPGGLRQRLAADGVAMRTMIDQIRVQLGWGRVLREEMGTQPQISEADLAQREASMKAQIGQTEYRVGEIFIPTTTPGQTDEARRFADTVIQQLRAGAPFAVVAAQFSQSQTALQGGDAGWVQGIELDPGVLRVVNEMPPGAISNPIVVPGGISVVTLRAKRQIGRESAVMLTLRQAFYRFPTKLDADHPTEAQSALVERAWRLSNGAKDCAAIEAAAREAGEKSGGNPGEVRLESVTVPALRQLMASQPIGKATQPLIADDGVAVMMICSRETKTQDLPGRKELAERIMGERFELVSRQLTRDLERRAVIERRR
jgi:peptidyl-prolyl cis-trans isomerase SurA